MQKTIFIVDDNATNLTMAEEVLSEHYRIIALPSAENMFKALEKFKCDLILLDVEMPGMSGFDAMNLLKSNASFATIPVIFLTNLSDAESEAYGIELGAADFITKPFSKTVLLNRIKNHLEIDELIRKRTEQLNRRTEQLIQLKHGIVLAMADIVENRDKNTGDHIGRTTVYMRILIDAMFAKEAYGEEIFGWDIETVVTSASMHDLGKIVVPDSILNKPGKLTADEFKLMQAHPAEGERIINDVIERIDDTGFLNNAKLFAAYHHEKWDGTGYPYGLKGTEIPLHGRIMAIIDVYDALVSERPYKKAFTHEDAVSIIMNDAGKHFDPRIADIFHSVNKTIKEAGERLKNG